jgi:hypothetical protein
MACTNTTADPPKVSAGFSNTIQLWSCNHTTADPPKVSAGFDISIYSLN